MVWGAPLYQVFLYDSCALRGPFCRHDLGQAGHVPFHAGAAWQASPRMAAAQKKEFPKWPVGKWKGGQKPPCFVKVKCPSHSELKACFASNLKDHPRRPRLQLYYRSLLIQY